MSEYSSLPDPRPEPCIGWPDTAWDRYLPEKLLGEGATGKVFKAWDVKLKRHVAIKFLNSDDPDLLKRFLREAQAQARVDHPHICKVYEVGEVAGRHYIAMQNIQGQPLNRLTGQLRLEQMVVVIRQVAEAVHEAHRIGLIHRDLKPANIMLETQADGSLHAFVVDFGLVREMGSDDLTVSGAALGTPSYMAPEQALGKLALIDRRTDVYNLGATLYALIAGAPPFAGSSPFESLMHVIHNEPTTLTKVRPGVPADLEIVVMKCLEKDPKRRYDSAKALAEDLDRYLNGEPIAAKAAGIFYRLGKKIRKNRALAVVTSVAAVSTLILLGLWWRTHIFSITQAELAQKFGRQVDQVDNLLWRARSLEIHDMRPVMNQARQMLRSVEEEMKAQGGPAAGPGHAALGKGYLALQNYTEARRHLDLAWQQGFRGSDVAFAAGLAYGKLYQAGFAGIRRTGNPAEREKQLRELQKTYRDPAVQFLESSRGATLVSPHYLRALLAYFRRDFDEALRLARQALQEVPWMYEALILEGDVRQQQGAEARMNGRWGEARQFFRQAETAYRAAARIGESDLLAWHGICDSVNNLLFMSVWGEGKPDETLYHELTGNCAQALRIDPGNVELHSDLSEAHSTWAEHLLQIRRDPRSCLTAALETARHVTRLAPGSSRGWISAASACWQMGKYTMISGGKAEDWYEQGLRHIRQALETNSRSLEAWSMLGLICLDYASYSEYRGQDPRPQLRQACQSFQQAGTIDSQDSALLVNQALALQAILSHEITTGEGDPPKTAAETLTVIDRALRLNPNLFWSHRVAGMVHQQLARYRMSRQLDPEKDFESALTCLNKSYQLNQTDLTGCTLLAEVLQMKAEWKRQQGIFPGAELAEGERWVRTGLKINPDYEYLQELLAFFKRARKNREMPR